MSLVQRLALRYPIIQAPMAGVSTPAMAAAVSNAGALGSLGLGASSVEQAQKMIKETQALTNKPFNLNFFCHEPQECTPEQADRYLEALSPFFERLKAKPPTELPEIYRSFTENEAMLAVVLAAKPAVVSFHFGLPSLAFIQALKEAGIYLLASATNLNEALQVQAAGIDAVIAQGYEAGGHRGVFDAKATDAALSTFVLCQTLVDQLSIPVIAAGGIMTGKAIKAVLALGAQAAQLGTAFVLCPESAADKHYRQAMQSEQALRTGITPVISGRPARGLINKMHTEVERAVGSHLAPYPYAYAAGKALYAAAIKQGDGGFGAFWAGEGASLATEQPAQQIINKLIQTMVS